MFDKDLGMSFKELFSPLTNRKAIWIIIIVGFIVFGNMLFNEFVWDDKVFILYNPDVHQINILQLFEPSNFNKATYYRPLVATYFAFLYSIFESNTFFYHFFQLLIHMGITFFVFLLYKKFLPQGIAFVLALIFLVHPINVESVSYIASVGNIVFVAFGLLATMLVLNKRITLKTGFIVWLALLVVLLIKETAILFILVLLVGAMFFKQQNIKNILSLGGVIVNPKQTGQI